MKDRLFIAIGVSRARGLPSLPGVWRSVRDLVGWADAGGYDIVEITDETKPVTVARIKSEIAAVLQPGLQRIIFYFVGHGYNVPPEQYLVLSAGPNVPDERIARDGLRDMLATYGPRQISVITDACMVMAPLKGLAVSVLDPDDGELPRQTFDGFYATQPNSQAFAFRANADQPELCLFSWVLHRALTFSPTPPLATPKKPAGADAWSRATALATISTPPFQPRRLRGRSGSSHRRTLAFGLPITCTARRPRPRRRQRGGRFGRRA